MGEPKISVILPAHNGARFVKEAVQSILDQTHRNIELIVMDDGSTDSTTKILAGFRDRRMQVVRQPNLWVSLARNRGISMATGDYIASMSHDDISHPERFSTQLEAMRQRKLDICFSWAEIIDDHGNLVDHFLQGIFNQPGENSEQMLEKLSVGNFLLAPSVVCRRECYCYYTWNVALFGLQDYALWLQMLQRFQAATLEVPLLKYRVHDSNISLSRFSDEYRHLEFVACQHLAKDPPVPSFPAARKVLAAYFLEACNRLIGDRDRLTDAYLAANRAMNLDPMSPKCYEAASAVLSAMNFEEASQIVRGIGSRVGNQLAYPLPLQSPHWFGRSRRHLKSAIRGWRNAF